MIDPNTETLVSLTDAAGLIPRRRGGRKCAVSTIYRWASVGCKGVVLESLQCGGTKVTSKEALARFFRRLTSTSGSAPEKHQTPAARRRAAEAAERALEREGV